MKCVRKTIAVGLLAGSAVSVACSGELAPTSNAGSSTGVDNPSSTSQSANSGGKGGRSDTTSTTTTDAAVDAIIDTSGIPIDAGVTLINPPGTAIDAGDTLEPQGAYGCPGISSFAISPSLVLLNQRSTVSATTNPAGAAVAWSATAMCLQDGSIGGFFGPDGGAASSSGDSLSFSCGSCIGAITITAQAQLEVVSPGHDAATNVCSGAAFTTISGTIVCECGDIFCLSTAPNYCPNADGGVCAYGTCTNTQIDVNNCGTCGTACASGATCVSGVCTTPPSGAAPTDAAGSVGEGDQ